MVGQGDISPYFLKWRDALCFVPPTFGWVDIFVLMHTHWMIGAIFVKFSELILIKNTKIVATTCQIFRLKSTKVNFGWDSAPKRCWDAYSAPSDLLAGFKVGEEKEEVEGGE